MRVDYFIINSRLIFFSSYPLFFILYKLKKHILYSYITLVPRLNKLNSYKFFEIYEQNTLFFNTNQIEHLSATIRCL